jgi:hypothetical protein
MSFAKRSPIFFITFTIIAALSILTLTPAPARAASVPFEEIQQKTDEVSPDEKGVQEDKPKRPISIREFFRLCKTKTPEEISTAIKETVADVSWKDEEGWTVLMYAAYSNPNPEVVMTLIRNGADVNEKDGKGDTALILAASQNPNPEVIMALIRNGADVNEKKTARA